jgi:hypothetical protein
MENYSYKDDTIIIETSNWDDYYMTWIKKDRKLTAHKDNHDHIILQKWNLSKQKWINQFYSYFTLSPIPDYYNYYRKKWDDEINSWKLFNSTEYSYSGDTLIEIKFNENSKDYKNLFLYNANGKLLLNKSYYKQVGDWKLDKEIINDYNIYDILLKNTCISYPHDAKYDTIKVVLDYYWHTNFDELGGYIPMLSKDNQWNIMQTNEIFRPGHTETTWTTTTFGLFEIPIGNKKYYLFRSSEGGEILLREDTITKKVFLVENDGINNTETLLYDFGMEVGDTLSHYFDSDEIAFTLRLDSIKNIQFDNGSQTRAYYLGIKLSGSNEYFYGVMTWIEGMGATSKFYYPRCIGIDGCEIYNTLLCFNKNSEVYYSNPNYDSCFEEYSRIDDFDDYHVILRPNPVSSELVIDTDLIVNEVKIFDVNGRLMMMVNEKNINVNDLKSGIFFVKIYFKDGMIVNRKIVKQ